MAARPEAGALKPASTQAEPASAIPPKPSDKAEASIRWPFVHAGRPEVRYDVDGEFHALYDTAIAATQMRERPMRRQRHYLIPQLLRQVATVSGEAAEVGCFRGLSAYVACSILQRLGRPTAFHVFDSFEGLSPTVDADGSEHRPVGNPNAFACPEATVRANLSLFDFIEYHGGWVPERFDDVRDLRFRYLHVDVDLHEPTRQSVEFFWPRLSAGGVLVLDDHATLYYPGARLAVEAFFAGRSDAVIVETCAGSAVVVKLG